MKNRLVYIVILLSLCMSSCVLDNYNAPDAQFYGSVIDEETFEPIQQDIIEGSRIEFVEQGFKNPNIRQIRFKTDGTFGENNLFSGIYEVRALRGNFFPTEKELIDINGKTEHIFVTRPYIRIHNVELSFDEIKGEVTAEFTLEQVASNPVASVHLIADINPNLSNSIRTVMTSTTVNAVVSQDQKFQVKMSTENLVSGKDYYFRVAALIAGIGEAKHNYSTPVRLYIDNSNVIPEVVIPGKSWISCESLDGWEHNGELSLDETDKKEGNASIRFGCSLSPYFVLQTKTPPLDTEVSMENGVFAFDFYISDASVIQSCTEFRFQIHSSEGNPDLNLAYWGIWGAGGSTMPILNNGWNKVELRLADSRAVNGGVNLSKVDFFRFIGVGEGNMVVKFDNIRFYEGEKPEGENVALHKPVNASSINSATGVEPEFAVDGDIRDTGNTRWVSDNSNNEQWLEVDLEGSYTIHTLILYRQTNATQQMQTWRFQVWNSTKSEWDTVVTEDNNPAKYFYKKEFTPVTTTKVRWYLPAYTDNRTRLYEIEVYGVPAN